MPVFNPPQFSDSQFRVWDNADFTKKVALEVSGISTATTRTLTPQNASYTIAGVETDQTWTGTNQISDVLWFLRNNADATDKARFSFDGTASGGTRILTIQNIGNYTLAALDVSQTWLGGQTFVTKPGGANSFILEYDGPGSYRLEFDLSGMGGDRIMTLPGSDFLVAGQDINNVFTGSNTYSNSDTLQGVTTIWTGTLGRGTSNDNIIGAQINAWENTGGGTHDFLQINDTATGSSSGFTYTLGYDVPTANRNLRLPNANGALMTNASTDNMTNKTMSGPGGIRCGTSTGSHIKFQNASSTTQIMMLDLGFLTTQRNWQGLNLAGIIALDTNIVTQDFDRVVTDESGNLIMYSLT